jgi:S-adenosylmethionine:diacylglycerol 3-amino-3-carboxypropyl transferase/ubiquinone/menaquinone biosynthesis C-methylase UbiE
MIELLDEYKNYTWLYLFCIIIYLTNKIYKIFNMDYLIGKYYIYNLSWEDPKTDIDLYNLNEGNKICMITTGGDNVLDYLIQNPKCIYTYDLNPRQNYLLELKMACIKELDQNECFEIFSRNNYKIFLKKFDKIKAHMSVNSQKWWEENKYIMKSFIYSGSVKYFAKLFNFLIWIYGLTPFFTSIKKNPGIKNQKKEYLKYEKKFKKLGNFVEKIKYYIISWIGVPVRQIKLDNDSEYTQKLFYHLCNNTDLVNDNYFFTGYIYGEFNENSCPRYLKKEFYDIVKSRLDRININTGLLQDSIIDNHDKDLFDRVILLDHMDWLNEKQIRDEWMILSKYTTPDCLFCWRSFSKNQSFGCLKNLDYKVSGFIDKLNKNKYFDRIGMYNSVHVASLNDNSLYNVQLPKYNLSFKNFYYTFKNICLSPFYNKDTNSFLNSFYKTQADNYDAYRYYLLHAKKELMTSIPFKKGDSLLLFAGGTGDVLDYLHDNIKLFKNITIMDICDPLLEKAIEKKKKYNWSNVKIVKGDAHDFVEEESYDIVLITYSLTMIPNWKLSIDNSISCLKKGGYLGVCDFTTRKNKLKIVKKFWEKLFSLDNVYINDEHIDYLKNKLEKVFIRYDFGGFPYIPFIKTGYYSTLLKKN